MSSQPIQLPFEADSTDSWKSRVERELKGKSYEDFLIWKSLDGFEIKAWQNTLPSPLPQLVPLTSAWKSVEPVYETDAQKANEAALHALMNGAEAVWFDKSFQGAAAEVVASKIDQSIAPVFINDTDVQDVFKNVLKSKQSIEVLSNKTQLINGFRLRERGATVIEEIAFSIAQWLELRKENKSANVIFKLGYGNQYLTEIAKTRAFRWLYASILKQEDEAANNPIILAVNTQSTFAQTDEHSNILRAASAGMSAVVGGAQFVMIEPWNKAWKQNDGFAARISRNIHNLMKDEGRLDKNLNQADGSYFIENLTVAIAKSAWELVQKVEAAGGFKAFAESGALKSQLETSRSAQIEAYKSAQKTLLGVNKYAPAETKTEMEPSANQYELLPDYLFIPTEIKA